ncbi:MAG: 50S ribosomal protein L18 [Nanoarchaeota archaeon]
MKKQSKLVKRRRREGKTDYRKRLVLLTGQATRLVVRKTNRYIILQLVASKQAQDSVICTMSTQSLLNSGWPIEKSGSLKSLSAAYLTGFALGKKMHAQIKGRVILDSGLIPTSKGSRVYAAVMGAVDGGLSIPFNKEVAPPQEKIERIEFFKKVKDNLEKDRNFSAEKTTAFSNKSMTKRKEVTNYIEGGKKK